MINNAYLWLKQLAVIHLTKMNMTFKKMFFATTVVAGLAACSSDKVGDNGELTGSNAIAVSVTMPHAATKGLVEDPITATTPQISKVYAYIMKGNTVVKKAEMVLSGSKYDATFVDVSLAGGERVVVAANDKKTDTTTPDGYSVYDVQPSGAKSLESIYYHDSRLLAKAVKTEANGKTVYTIPDMELRPQASRVEVSGEIKFNPELIKSLSVVELTPNNYSEAFGSDQRFKAQPTKNDGDITSLGKLASKDFYDLIKGGNKVVANHLFNGDEKRISFRLDAHVYDVLLNDNLERVKPVDENNVVFDSYVYKSGADANLKLYVKKGSDFFLLTKTEKGTLQILKEKYDVAKTAEAAAPELNTYSTAEKSGYFNMVKFAAMNADGTLNNDASPYYEQGKIYKVFFDKIDWNGDGKVDSNDAYDPVDNGDGGTTPSTSKTDIVVGVTVMEWTIENTGASIE